MDKETVIALAKKTDLWQILETYSGEFGDGFVEADCLPELMAFANLIHDHLTYSSVHSCHPGCTKPACVSMRKAEAHAAAVEREACANIALTGTGGAVQLKTLEIIRAERERIADAIRNRSN